MRTYWWLLGNLLVITFKPLYSWIVLHRRCPHYISSNIPLYVLDDDWWLIDGVRKMIQIINRFLLRFRSFWKFCWVSGAHFAYPDRTPLPWNQAYWPNWSDFGQHRAEWMVLVVDRGRGGESIYNNRYLTRWKMIVIVLLRPQTGFCRPW